MSQDTKDSILDAAADLFGEQGFNNVSIRDITKKAQVNLSAISYHFTDKEGLIDRVIGHNVTKLNKNRNLLLVKANYDFKDKPPLRSILEAFITPLFLPEIHKTKPNLIAALAARTMIQNSEHNPYNHKSFIETVENFSKAMKSIHPQLTTRTIRNILKLSAGAAITFRSFSYDKAGPVDNSITKEIYTEDLQTLLNYCEAGAELIINKFLAKQSPASSQPHLH